MILAIRLSLLKRCMYFIELFEVTATFKSVGPSEFFFVQDTIVDDMFPCSFVGKTPVFQYSSRNGVSAYLLRTRCTSGMKPTSWYVSVVLNWRSLKIEQFIC